VGSEIINFRQRLIKKGWNDYYRKANLEGFID